MAITTCLALLREHAIYEQAFKEVFKIESPTETSKPPKISAEHREASRRKQLAAIQERKAIRF